MKIIRFLLLSLLALSLYLLAGYFTVKCISYPFLFEDNVKATVIKMVKPEGLVGK